ncbi:uncharacterized protein LOC100679596 [Nasonia vitripennis]|uniref:C-type lectin domain-containing protein n=1 Tax=Nasonia vitripennis TaxID=7425 RepID=A0A7M7TAE1_NASVI|nr:uncharacterized protein LOC100679596 [Nasonia vitripennis]
MKIYVSRNFRASATLLILCFGLVECLRIGSLRDDVIERFYYTVQNKSADEESVSEVEFLVIGRKVPWMEAKALCPSYDDDSSSHQQMINPEDVIELDNTIQGGGKDSNTSLATFRNEEERNWLARMLSESNYRYEGLWIGGSRRNKSDSWRWTSEQKMEDSVLSNSMVYENYPAWYTVSHETVAEQNCLLFNRIGHDVPVFIPEKCNLPRPFICMRDAKKRSSEKISEAASISIDGYRYTLYRVTDNTDDCHKSADVKRLNGGGVSWRDAMFECRKRGQHLAMVFTNEAATAIADMMLKNRPSMENVWLGGWSSEGKDWTWVSSGSTLSMTKSSTTRYPPWLEGHPVAISKSDYYYQRRSRCLILDRHLCPDQIAPVFLDLDCEKERPFVCQDGLGIGNQRNLARRSIVEDEIYEFSEDKMAYSEGEDYCNIRNGQIASILNSKSLSACLDKMSELSIDHVWINGRTLKVKNEYRWVDENDKPLSPKGIGAGTSWCFGEENDFLPKAEPNSCLNLDYEARGFPLFYGLPCNSSQIVLCSLQNHSEKVVEVHADEVDTRSFGSIKDKKQMKNETEPSVANTTTTLAPDFTTTISPVVDKDLGMTTEGTRDAN